MSDLVSEIDLHCPPATVRDSWPKVARVVVVVEYADGTSGRVEVDGATRARLGVEVDASLDVFPVSGGILARRRSSLVLRLLDADSWLAWLAPDRQEVRG